MLPTAAGSILLKKCESKSELKHQEYEKWVLQLRCLMQTGIDGYEIYKHVGVMHAVVFVGGALEAKNAQVMGRNQNVLKGSISEQIPIGTAKRAIRANHMTKNALFEAAWEPK